MNTGQRASIARSKRSSRVIGVGWPTRATRGSARKASNGSDVTRRPIYQGREGALRPDAPPILRDFMTRRAAITSIGRNLPERVLDNKYFEQFAATNDEWIRTRTGIVTRHHAPAGTGSSELGTKAARECLERRGIAGSEIDCIVVATVTPDMIF